ncbi:RCC1 domain-containing protein [Paenibacillus farraposensis]|uniref:RCC1 domain-containing protein n=1 Tax=Paenibacillus farraposensis TaxID=2807095 RepID=UPI001E42544E|nr:S-layer homology domain-containing protein [Paenibacillus farraposensis]MCC3380485.1 S-layer homology domain-containing protein [Paenibacillus farraposensis]
MKRKSFIAIWVCMFALFVFSSNVFAVPSDLVTIKSIAGGDNHTLYLTESGKVYAAGNNEFGQLGSGDTQMREIAVRIDHSKEIRKISAGGNQSAFVDATNDLYVTGANSEGQLGLGDTINKSSFMKVSGLPPIVDVAVGRDHILALDMDGNVWASGSNDAGQLGLGNFSSQLNFTKLSSLNGVASIFAGNKISAAILTDHTVMMWGSNWAGQLGLGDDVTRNSPTASPIHNVTKIAFGYYSTFFISSGTTYAAGYNANGQLGDGSTSYALTPVPVGDFMDAASGSVHSIAVKRDGTVVGTGSNFYGQINQSSPWGSTNWTLFNNIHNAKAVISGESYSAILTSDGKVIGSGWNGYGQLAIGTNLTNGSFSATIKGSAQSISIGLNHVSEINKMGQLFNWGSNLVGQLGNGGVYVQSPQMISSVPGTLKKVVSGNSHTLVMTDNNGAIELYGTGNNAFGQLSDGTTNSKYSFGRIGVGLPNIKDIAAGDNASYVLDQSGNVWSSGDNAKGQLGLGDFTPRSTFVQMPSLSGIQAISANGATFIALKSDGTVYTVGEGVKGQLGNGTNTNSNTPVQVNGITDAVKITAGYEHNLVLKANGKVVAFGLNNYGQLGDGTNDNKNVPVMVSGIGKAQDIFAGYLNSGAIDQSGNTMLWGRNVYGQLGNNSFASSNIPLNVNVPNVKAIVFGLNQTGLINASGDVLFAGWNGYGQFGDGATVSSNEPVSIKYDKPSISYSTNTVQETATNDGTITGALTVTLTGDEFNDTVTNDVYVGNLPTGITYTVTKDSASKLTLQFAGQVVQHKAADSVTNAYVTIRKSGLVHTPLEDITAGLFSIPYLDPNLPSVVSDVTATYGGSTATIRWTKNPYATSYELKRNGTTIYTGTDTEYTDSGLVQGTTYTYTVVPVNPNGKGEEKSISFVMDSKYPGSPGNLTAVQMSSVTMSVYWDVVPTATSYILKRDNVVIYTGSATSFTDTIADGKRYEYSVAAQNAYGVGNASTLTVTTDTDTDTDTNESEAPLSPQNLTGQPQKNSVLLTWNAAAGATKYKIKQNGKEIAQVTSLHYLVDQLNSNTLYTFTVTASNNYGESAPTEIILSTLSMSGDNDNSQNGSKNESSGQAQKGRKRSDPSSDNEDRLGQGSENKSKDSDPGSSNEIQSGQGNNENKGSAQSGSIIQHTFEDIYDPQWATEAIIKLYNLKIINGYSAKEFKPKKNITRAEYVKVLVLALGEPAAVEQDKTPDFEDVTNPDWYYNYIKLARRMGLAKGDAYNLFYLNKEITRKEAIAILVRALRYRESIPKSENPENQLNKFKDTASLRDWSSDEIALSIEKHLIEGYEDSTLRLDNQINRAEVCVLVTRLLDRLHGK